MVVIIAGGRRLLLDRDDGGGFEARGDNSLAQRGVEDVREDIRELLSTVPQDPTRNVVRTQGFPWVRPSEGIASQYPGIASTPGRKEGVGSSVPGCCCLPQSGRRSRSAGSAERWSCYRSAERACRL